MASLLLAAAVVRAQVDTQVTVQITSGILSLNAPPSVDMGSVMVPVVATTARGDLAGVTVTDGRSADSFLDLVNRWSVTAYAKGDLRDDRNTPDPADDRVIPIGQLSFTTKNLLVKAGNGQVTPGSGVFTTNQVAQATIATAVYGAGQYAFDVGLTLAVPLLTQPGNYTTTIVQTVQ